MCNMTFGKFCLLMFCIVVGWPILGPIVIVLATVIGSICLLVGIAVGFVMMCLPKKKVHKGKKSFTFRSAFNKRSYRDANNGMK